MFPCLRLDGFVRRDYQQHEVDTRGASEHVPHKAFMPGDINESGSKFLRQVEVCKPKVDGDAAPFLFLQAIGVDTGEGLDERGFAMIDVAGRTDNDAPFQKNAIPRPAKIIPIQ
jgi:hypothetical protein